MKSTKSLQPDVKELVLCESKNCACETYVFEPAPTETSLGYLLVAGEITNEDQKGQELLDIVVAAIQKEYYRNPNRSPLASFESALRQANLILSEVADSGQKKWMSYFNVALAVLEQSNLHVSVAGEGSVLIGRKLHLNDISVDLAQFPIVNPLNTFSQVASGNVIPSDTIWLGTSELPKLFLADDLARLSSENSATNIAHRMQEIYRHQEKTNPLATCVISIMPNYVAIPRKEEPLTELASKRQAAAISPDQIKPRQPLEIKKSSFKNLIIATIGLLKAGWHKLWPLLKKGSVKAKEILFRVSKKTHQGVSTMAQGRSLSVVKQLPSRMDLSQTKSWPTKLSAFFNSLPRASKIFAILTLILAIALVTSLLLLQRKRTNDETIQKASEILHQAETKKDAADMALIYNNREQARLMLADAESLLEELSEFNLYTERRDELSKEIQAHYDRLRKITRADAATTIEIGDFGNVITQRNPSHLFWVDEKLYTFNPENNAIVMMDKEGSVTTASSNTQGVDFFTTGIVHQADKTIILASSTGDIAIFDTASATLRKQDVDLPSGEPEVRSISAFGARLYAYDKSADNIISLNKTLRGFSSSGSWITSETFPKSNIKSIAVDGNIFTLHEDGSIHRLFKGEAAEFNAETVEPSLAGASRIITSEGISNVYIVDPQNQRVVIYNKQGALVRQVMLDTASNMSDIAVGPQEKSLYVLDGTKVLKISLED